jgi:hypothetical protein
MLDIALRLTYCETCCEKFAFLTDNPSPQSPGNLP